MKLRAKSRLIFLVIVVMAAIAHKCSAQFLFDKGYISITGDHIYIHHRDSSQRLDLIILQADTFRTRTIYTVINHEGTGLFAVCDEAFAWLTMDLVFERKARTRRYDFLKR